MTFLYEITLNQGNWVKVFMIYRIFLVNLLSESVHSCPEKVIRLIRESTAKSIGE